MKKVRIFISIFCVLFSLSVWSQDLSTFELPKERIEELEEKETTGLRIALMVNMALLDSIEFTQEVSQAIGITNDSKFLTLPYPIGALIALGGFMSLSETIEKNPTFFIKSFLSEKEYRWFLNYDELISQIVDQRKNILRMRREAGFKNISDRLRLHFDHGGTFIANHIGRETLNDIGGKNMSSFYSTRYGTGFKAGHYQALLDKVKNNPNIPDRDKKIKALQSLVRSEHELVSLKRQVSFHMTIRSYPGLRKYNLVKLIRGSAVPLSLGGLVLTVSVVSGSVVVMVNDASNLSEVRKNLQAETDYILYLLSENNEIEENSATGF